MSILTRLLIPILCVSCVLAPDSVGGATMDLAKPTPEQAAWHDLEVEMFVHFGPATWQDSEYDTLATPTSEINPTKLDTDQWARTAVAMGAKQIVFAAKHSGGFCWWQTDTTNYGVKETPWKGGKGDVVADLAKSCHKYGLKLGIYLSIQDDHWAKINGKPMDRKAYGEAYHGIYRRQLTEILTRYGRIDEIWFDGGIDIPISDIIRKHGQHALLFQGPGELPNQLRWVGNEEGYADYPCWNSVRAEDLVSGKLVVGDPNGTRWAPAEVDTVNVSPHYWFWRSTPERRLRSLDELVDCYYRSVGHGCVLILNQTPDTTGLIPQADADRAAELGAEIGRRFAKAIASTSGKGNIVDLELSAASTIDHIVTMEDITHGERVRQYVIQGRIGEIWRELCHGTAIGHKKIDRIDPAKVEAIRLICTDAAAEPIIRSLAVYDARKPADKAASGK